MDSGTLLAAAAVGTGLMFAASMSGDDDAKTATPSSALSPTAATPAAPSLAVAPQPVRAPIPEPAKPASNTNYCYAYLTVGEERGSTCSPVIEINDTDRTGSVFQTRLNSYVEKVKQSQPGIWGDFEYSDTIKMQNAFIYQMKPKTNDAAKQDVGLICYVSRADADAQLKRSQKNDSSMKIVGWP
ncbi:hypothetical protein [Pseudomonas sp. LT1P18]|uniref:hypothetical protein n=1 Tax=Pseudomonas arabinosi TaxID=3398357 RepID=UPI0039F06426